MADSSRVEELRKRYHENPRRFFAPLANEYRKGGFLDRAILLCQKHLGEQPGNMNGLIVYGQTLFESGRHEEARGPFEAALELDPENLIALRHLGDVARLSGDHPAAQKWYERVLEYDRRNDEVRELLDQVGGPTTEPKSASGEPARSSTAARTVELPAESGDRGGLTLLGNDVAAPATEPAPSARPAEKPAVDPTFASAKTVEITPRPRPTPQDAPPAAPAPRTHTPFRARTPAKAATPARGLRRASLLDISFDFGELAAADAAPPPSKAAAPVLGAEAAEYGFAINTTDLPLLDPVADVPTPSLMSSEPVMESLIDMPPEPVSLGEIAPLQGIEKAEYEADVAPLEELEPAAFDAMSAGGAGIAPLPDLETAEFEVPRHDEPLAGLPELEPTSMPTLDEFEVESGFPSDAAIVSAAAEPAIVTPAAVPVVEEKDTLPMLEMDDFGLRTPAAQPAIVSETMAELYLEQGHRAEAIEVYRKLVAQDPRDTQLIAKLAALETAETPRQSMEFDVPAEAADVPVERAPENAMLSEVSFADLALSTPAVDEPVPVVAPLAPPAARPAEPVPSGPTAREFFAAFALRGAPDTPATSAAPAAAAAPMQTPEPPRSSPSSGGWAIPAAISSLDDLFGSEVTDEDQRAANYIAGIGTTSAPSGTSTFDALFSANAPEKPAPRNSVPRASEKLKFDQFFSASSSAGTASAAPEREAPSVPEPESGPSAGTDEDDLDQFQGWLKGLTQ